MTDRRELYSALRRAQDIHNAERKVVRRRALKEAAIQAMGGKCKACGGEFPHAVFEFHHTGGDDKVDHLSRMLKDSTVSLVATELSKCVLLCANCHRLEHERETAESG